jgi:hypothetical protein
MTLKLVALNSKTRSAAKKLLLLVRINLLCAFLNLSVSIRLGDLKIFGKSATQVHARVQEERTNGAMVPMTVTRVRGKFGWDRRMNLQIPRVLDRFQVMLESTEFRNLWKRKYGK